MKATIILGHGSRMPDAGRDMELVAARLKSALGHEIVEMCYFSRLKPDLPDALARCAAAGATEIVVIPYFLLDGVHIRLDIPEMLKAEAEKYPGVRIVCGPSLGYDDSLAELVHKRAGEAAALPDVRALKIEGRERFPK